MTVETRWSLAWAERPAEEATNLNPAFCCELIGRTVGEYFKLRKAAVNLPVSFLVLPLVLHKPTRDALPGRANVAFAGWVAEKNPLLAELPDRVRRLLPISREALLFALQHEVLALRDGGFIPGAKPIKPKVMPDLTTDDVDEARSAAALLGRWFGAQWQQLSILKGMGIAP